MHVAFVADSVDSMTATSGGNEKCAGKLNNGAAGKEGPCDYCLTVLKVEKFHATRNFFVMQNQGKTRMSQQSFGTCANSGAKIAGHGGGVPATRGRFKGRGGGRGNKSVSFNFSKNGKAYFAQSDGLAYRARLEDLR